MEELVREKFLFLVRKVSTFEIIVNAFAVVGIEQDNAAYYSQQFKAMEASFVSRHEESSSVAAENGCDVSGRRDASSSSLSNSIESLRTILSDPLT